MIQMLRRVLWVGMCSISVALSSDSLRCLVVKENTALEDRQRAMWSYSRAFKYWMGCHVLKCSWVCPNTLFTAHITQILCTHALKGIDFSHSANSLTQNRDDILGSLKKIFYNDLKTRGTYPLFWKKQSMTYDVLFRFWVEGVKLLDPSYDREALVFCIHKIREGYGDHPVYMQLEHVMKQPRHAVMNLGALSDEERQLRQEVRDTISGEQFGYISLSVLLEPSKSATYRVSTEKVLSHRSCVSESWSIGR